MPANDIFLPRQIQATREMAQEYRHAASQLEAKKAGGLPGCYRRGEPEDWRRLADAYDMAADAWGWLDAFPVGAFVLCDGHDYKVAGYGHDTPAGVVPGLRLVRPGRDVAIAMNFDHAMEGCDKGDLDDFAEALEEVEVMPDHDVLVRISGVFMICGSEVRMSNVLGEITCAPYDFSSFAKTPVWITLREYHEGYADAHPDHTSAELWTGDTDHPNAEGSYAIECNVRFTNGVSEHTRLEAVRCEHSACSQNYIDTGDTACIS